MFLNDYGFYILCFAVIGIIGVLILKRRYKSREPLMGHIIHLVVKLLFIVILYNMLFIVIVGAFPDPSEQPNYFAIALNFVYGLSVLHMIFYHIKKMLIDRKINTIPEKESNKKPKAGIAIKRRDKLELLIFLSFVVSAIILGISGVDNTGEEGLIVAGAIIGIYGLWRFLVLFVQKRHFYCPKCKNKCKWEVTDSRIDDLTTRRKDGQVDRRYSSVTVRYYYFKYYCIDTPYDYGHILFNYWKNPKALLPWKTNPTCGYKFGEWQSTYTYSEKQNYYNN